MHKNLIWQSFLLLLATISLYYTGTAIYRSYSYHRLTETVSPSSLIWEIKELASDKYRVEALYQFQANEQSFSGKYAWEDAFYLNPWAARKTIEEYQIRPWKIWYDPHYPLHSSLQKKFPLKQCVTAASLWVLWFYFLGIGYYVAKFKA